MQAEPPKCKSQRSRKIRFSMTLFTRKAPSPLKFETMGGVYSDSLHVMNELNKSFSSVSTAGTSSSHESTFGWTSSGLPGHHRGAPLLVRRPPRLLRTDGQPSNDETNKYDEDEASALGNVMLKSRKLPQDSWYYSSNHIMINAERTKKIIQPLVREIALDNLAREHAVAMAENNKLYHSDLLGLQGKIGEPCRRLGENVMKGSSIHEMHKTLMQTSISDKNNILDRRFTSMGIGTAKSSDGTLYLCQIFRS